MAGRSERLGWKVIGLGAAIPAGILARKVVTAAWTRSTGTPPPTNPEAPDVTWAQALAWAMATGAAVGVARMLTARRLAAWWRRSTGHLPPGMREVA
jgi:hypothetical protein